MTYDVTHILILLVAVGVCRTVQSLPTSPPKEHIAAGLTNSQFCTNDTQCQYGYYCYGLYSYCYKCTECCNGEPATPLSKCFEVDGLRMCMSCPIREGPCEKGGACNDSSTTTTTTSTTPTASTTPNGPISTLFTSTLSSTHLSPIYSETTGVDTTMVHTTIRPESKEKVTQFLYFLLFLLLPFVFLAFFCLKKRYSKYKTPEQEKYEILNEEKEENSSSDGDTNSNQADEDNGDLTKEDAEPMAGGPSPPPNDATLSQTSAKPDGQTNPVHSKNDILPASTLPPDGDGTLEHIDGASLKTDGQINPPSVPSHGNAHLEASIVAPSDSAQIELIEVELINEISPILPPQNGDDNSIEPVLARQVTRPITPAPLTRDTGKDIAKCPEFLKTLLNPSSLEVLKIYLDVDNLWAIIGEKFAHIDQATLYYFGSEKCECKSPIEAVLRHVAQHRPMMPLAPFLEFLCKLKLFTLLNIIDLKRWHPNCPLCSKYFITAHLQQPSTYVTIPHTPQQAASSSPTTVGQQAHHQPPPPQCQGPITTSHHHSPSNQTSAGQHLDQSRPTAPSHMIAASHHQPPPPGHGPQLSITTASHHHPPSNRTSAGLHPDQSGPAPPGHMTTASQSGPAPPGHMTAASHSHHHPKQRTNGQAHEPVPAPSLTAAATPLNRPHPPAQDPAEIVLLNLLENLVEVDVKRLKFYLKKRDNGTGIAAGLLEHANNEKLADLMVKYYQPISQLKETLERALHGINRKDLLEEGYLNKLTD